MMDLLSVFVVFDSYTRGRRAFSKLLFKKCLMEVGYM